MSREELVASAMTRHVSVSLGRRLSLEDLNDNSQTEMVVVDSPQNGDVDVVTVDNPTEEDPPLAAEKTPFRSPGITLMRVQGHIQGS